MPLADSTGAQHLALSVQDWRKHQQTIHDLYIYQNLSLNAIREQLQEQYSFDASIPQYKRKLKEWRYSKNLKASTCKALGDSLERRRLTGSNAVTVVDGVTLSPKRLQRALRRHHVPTLEGKFGLNQRTTTPEGVSIRRSIVESLSLSNIKLPSFSWLQQALQFSATLQHATPNPFVHAQSPQSHSTEPIEASNNFVTVDVLSMPLDKAAASGMLNYLPRLEPDYAGQNFNSLIHQAGSVDLHSLISYVIYLGANNHLEEDQFDHFMDQVLPQSNRDTLKYLARSKSVCTWKFTELVLFYAARTGRYDLVDLLKYQWTFGSILTPRTKKVLEWMLIEAIQRGHETFALTLLKEKIGNNGCRIVDLISQIDKDLLRHAAHFQPSICLFILDSMSTIEKAQVLPVAAKAELSIEVISSLIYEGADVNATDDDGCAALCYSARNGDFELTQLLLQNGASVEGAGSGWFDKSLDARCIPPLFFAAQSGHKDICELLLRALADVESCWHQPGPRQNLDGQRGALMQLRSFRNAVEVAIWNDQTSVLECLVAHGANMNGTESYSPLVFAMEKGSSNSVELLIRYGADIHKYCLSEIGTEVRKYWRAPKPVKRKFWLGGPNTEIRKHCLSEMETEIHKYWVGMFGETKTRITALQAACSAGDKKGVSLLIGAGAEINDPAMEHGGMTALQCAARRGDERLVEYLLDLGAEVNAPCAQDGGLSALQAAILSKNETLVRILLARGANVNGNISQKNGRSAIVAAVEAEAVSVFWDLVAERADLSTIKLDDGTYCCPFLTAAKKSSTYFVNLLLGLMIDIDARLDSGYSLAEEAIRSSTLGSWRVVGTILNHSPAVRLSCCQDRTPLVDMWDGIDLSFIRILVERGMDISQEFVGDDYFDFSFRQESGGAKYRSFLQKACAMGNLETVEYLLSAGADPNALPYPNFDEMDEEVTGTALQLAIMKEQPHLIKTLLRYGADVNTPHPGYCGRTALQAVSAAGDLQLVELLLDHGADVNAPASDWAGMTALQGAAIEGSIRVVQVLLSAGADVGAPGAMNDGRTAVDGAAEWGRLDIVKLLLDLHPLQRGESLSEICRQAAEYARKEHHWAVVDLLETYERMPGSP
ncbi:hypothetical protein AYO20_01725 [Fonsecaea nubica]|uniref:Clr5 domain-containing protein n=1 Tax=Fonsecaea nubica TaxID=856822 RepID=A0A178DCD7_9EURO|nr:hypothetical protein AYO20_01725 [Fonsecaea nubica]OAL38974.1 hypothetical protein AYO20_01725 [Fonsecaea nubica]